MSWFDKKLKEFEKSRGVAPQNQNLTFKQIFGFEEKEVLSMFAEHEQLEKEIKQSKK
jgi:hypothetical protein